MIPAASFEAAEKVIEELDDLDIAVIDLYLREPPVGKEGLELLKKIQTKFRDRCFRILVSAKITDKAQLESDLDLFQDFVYLRRLNGVNPYDRLTTSLRKAREFIELAEAK